MSDARAAILERIRTALGPERADVPAPVTPLAAPAPPAELLALFADRVADYRATIALVPPGDDVVRKAVAAALARHDARRIAVPDGVPAGWLPEAIEVVPVREGTAPDPQVLDEIDGVLTTSALAIAETGTIVLDGGAGQGPRAATLLPDLHVCVVDASRIVAGVPEAIATLGPTVGRPLTFVSGPSATSDIELDRVEGVHGPRRLEVVLRDDLV